MSYEYARSKYLREDLKYMTTKTTFWTTKNISLLFGGLTLLIGIALFVSPFDSYMYGQPKSDGFKITLGAVITLSGIIGVIPAVRKLAEKKV